MGCVEAESLASKYLQDNIYSVPGVYIIYDSIKRFSRDLQIYKIRSLYELVKDDVFNFVAYEFLLKI